MIWISISIYVGISLVLASFTLNSMAFPPVDIDMDNAGNHIVRDDDGTREHLITQYQGDEIYKRLWVYYNNIEDVDLIQLWIYAKLYESAPTGPTHELYINNILVKTFAARDHFVPGQWRWAALTLSYTDLAVGACNEICIRSIAATVIIDYGVDQTFQRVDELQNNIHDFDRSYWYDDMPVPTFTLPTQFDGEFMIYLEFVAVYEEWSMGYKTENAAESKILKYAKAGGSDWDSAGFELDWTGMDQQTFNDIYKVRFWVYCKPDGVVNLADNQALKLMVNGNEIYTFNPWKEIPWGEYSWKIFTIHDIADGFNRYLGYGAGNGLNHIDIHANNANPNDNYLKIAKYHSTIDNQYTWWYIKTGSNPDTFDGEYQAPGSCNGDLAMRVEVFLSDSLKDSTAKLFRFGSSAIINNRDLDFNGYSMNGPNFAKNSFDADQAYDNNYLQSGPNVRQWTIYGEQRSYSESSVGDCTDIYFHYGPGKTGTLALFELEINGGQWLIGQSTYHNNDDRHDFTTTGVTLTEAENNDFSTLEEDDGSNGFNFDLEWIFIFSDHVLSDGKNSWYQTLLWHGGHALFGFNDISQADLEDVMLMTSAKLSSEGVVSAFEAACDWYGVQGRYFYNTNYPGEWMWGQGMSGHEDTLDRTTFDYAETDE
jgi:hypothetical protein